MEKIHKIFVHYFRSSLVLKLVGLFFLLSWGASICGITPSLITSILALIWIVYVPFGIGNFILLVMKMTKWLEIRRFSIFVSKMRIANILVKWFMGFLLILGAGLLAVVTHTNIPASILGSSMLLISISVQFLPRTKTVETETIGIEIGKGVIKMLLISLLVGLSFALYVRSFSPYPLSPGFDIFAHVYVIKSVLSGVINTTTVMYFPSFHIMIALALATFNADVIGIFWSGSFLLFSLFAISIYAMSYWLTRNELLSFLACIIGLAVTEMGWVPSTQVLYPSSLVMSIFPITFYVIDTIWTTDPNRSLDKGKFLLMPSLKPSAISIFRIITTLIVFAGMIIIHPDLGIVADLILLSYLIFTHYITKNNSLLLLARVATVSIAIVILFYLWGYITFQALLIHNFGGKMVDFNYLYNTSIKNMHLGQWYSVQTVTISVIGLIVLSFFNDRRIAVLGLLASIILLIYFQNIAFIDRIMTLERPLLSFAAATALMSPVSIVFKRDPVFGQGARRSKSNIIQLAKVRLEKLAVLTISQRPTRTSLVYTIIVIILLFPLIMKPYDIYIQPYSEHADAFVNFTNEELNAAKYIEKSTPHNYLIFSDPFTVMEMRGLAFRENIPFIGWNLPVAKFVKSLMIDQTAHDSYKKIVSQYGDKLLIVITPRTSEWLRTINLNSDVTPDNYFVQFPIENFKSFEGFSKFFDLRYFNLIYKSDNIFVFTPRAPTAHH